MSSDSEARRPDPDPAQTAGLDDGQSVRSGDTPPGEASTSQAQDNPVGTVSAVGSPERKTRGTPVLLSAVGIALIIVIVLVVLLV